MKEGDLQIIGEFKRMLNVSNLFIILKLITLPSNILVILILITLPSYLLVT